MKKAIIVIFIALLPLLFGCTQDKEVGEGVYPPLLMFQNELYITSPNQPDMYIVDDELLTQVSVIESTVSASPSSGIHTENFQSNFGVTRHINFLTTSNEVLENV